jgi:hypothetical protein
MRALLGSIALLALCGCTTQPAFISPYVAPIALPINQYVETREPERLVCQAGAALVCAPMLAARVANALWSCVCMP